MCPSAPSIKPPATLIARPAGIKKFPLTMPLTGLLRFTRITLKQLNAENKTLMDARMDAKILT
jgi:hypothetical protein